MKLVLKPKKLKSFQQESVEWEKASQFLCESLATKSDLELTPAISHKESTENEGKLICRPLDEECFTYLFREKN